MKAPPLRARLESSFREALAELDPAGLVTRALPPLPPKRAKVLVVAAGKAAPAMAAGAIARWGDRVDALVVTVDGAPHVALGSARVELHAASHPLPDARSEAAARRALERADELREADLLVALVSGGASSLLACPAPGLTLGEKIAISSRLLDAGEPIQAVNLVRRHLSAVKDGRLAVAASPARVLTLALSDVIGGALRDIGSGPTALGPSDAWEEEALAILGRAGVDGADLLARGVLRSSPTLADGRDGRPVRLRGRILAGPDDLARAVASRLGAGARILQPETGDAPAVAARRVEQAHRLAPGEAVVIACEPTLRLPPTRGRGGRAGWIALAVAPELPAGVVFLAAASDGVDGSSGAAGACIDASVPASRARAALAAFDDAALHAELGTALAGGPTGLNLCDVHVLAREA